MQVNQKLTTNTQEGFTLIELSIVLVIIGLIIGGILTGQDLINAATIRAQISQIEKYNTAVRTFQGKYGYLPGDIPNPYATNFGFVARGSGPGEGDGNGILQGNSTGSGNGFGGGDGELAVFWGDLSAAGLIDAGIVAVAPGSTTYPNATTFPSGVISPSTTPNIDAWLPRAKIGNGNYVYVYSDASGTNYYDLSTVTLIFTAVMTNVNPGVTVQQAYNIDTKVDDGLPQSGNVIACLASGNSVWAAGYPNTGAPGGSGCSTPTTATTNYETYNCYDNAIPGSAAGAGGQSGKVETYSTSKNGTVPNCALSFRFQ